MSGRMNKNRGPYGRTKNDNSRRQSGSESNYRKRKYEEYAWILAYLPEGSPTDSQPFGKRDAVFQALGEMWFTLLELLPKRGVKIKPLTRVGIGKKNRKLINKIKRRIGYEDLSPYSEKRLEDCIIEIISKQEFRFVNWFNKASLVTSRMHSFKLLPGIGKSTLENILKERSKIQFTGFEDISDRTKISDPKKVLAARIIKELQNPDEKYRLFTRKP
ncbi:MAG: DUF655 domain-containing protein [Candidatus Heimdallarchaeota archaeon]|nr:DUF655 domain-containing protein [Candidatus Heimdallarchaeota archaeon]